MRGYPSETDNAYEVTQVVGDTADGCGQRAQATTVHRV